MKDYKLNWTAEELKAYILLFFINIDYPNVNSDLNKYPLNNLEFNNIRQEFKFDNDYQSIQKICKVVETANYTKMQLQVLLEEVKNWFTIAGEKQRYLLNNRLTILRRILIKTL